MTSDSSFFRTATVAATLLSLCACDDAGDGTALDTTRDPAGGDALVPATFVKTSQLLPGAAFMQPISDADGTLDFLVSSLAEDMDFDQISMGRAPFTPGALHRLTRSTDDPDGVYASTTIFDQTADIRWPNQPTIFDVDNDGADEFVVGWGFLSASEGGLAYVDIAEDGSYSAPIAIVERSVCATDGETECGWYFHEAKPLDVDGDGKQDFVTTSRWGGVDVGGNSLDWYRNVGGEGEARYEPQHIADAGGTLVELHDLDEDGDMDLITPQFFGGESLVWFERLGSGSDVRWEKHVIDDSTGRGFQVHVADIDGDGRDDLIYANHNHQDHPEAVKQTMGVYWWSVPENVADVADWSSTKQVIHEGFEVAAPAFTAPNPDAEAAPGYFAVGDLHGDGRLDLVVSGDGDPGLYILEQEPEGSFVITNLDSEVSHSNSGAQWIVDANGDGKMDIIWAAFESMPEESAVITFTQQ